MDPRAARWETSEDQNSTRNDFASDSKGPNVYLHTMTYSTPFSGPLHVVRQLKPQPYSKLPCATFSPVDFTIV